MLPEVLSPPQYCAKHYRGALTEIRELAGDGKGAVSGGAILDILERHGFVNA